MRKARWMFLIPSLLALLDLTTVVGVSLSQREGAGAHPATGVGSCTLKGWNPRTDPNDAKDLPEGQRPQTYKRDDYNCSFFFNDTATTEIYTLSLHDALPIWG